VPHKTPSLTADRFVAFGHRDSEYPFSGPACGALSAVVRDRKAGVRLASRSAQKWKAVSLRRLDFRDVDRSFVRHDSSAPRLASEAAKRKLPSLAADPTQISRAII
jgi:hypothetical protein